MLHAMKFFRNFVLITMLVNGSFVLASGLFPFKLDSNKSSELVNRTPALLHHLKFDWFKNINIEPCTTFVIDNTTFVINKAINNPKMSGVVATFILSGIILCILKKAMSENQWQKFWTELKNFVVSKSSDFAHACYDVLPDWARGFLLLSKTPAIFLKNVALNYFEYNKKFACLTLGFAAGGKVIGWPMAGYICAGGAFACGIFLSNFDRLENKMKELHAETMQNINEVKEQIDKLGRNVDNKIDGVSQQVAGVADKAQRISDQISSVEGNLKAELNRLGTENMELAKGLTQQIDDVKQSFTKTLESKIESSTNQLMQKIEVSDKNKEEDLQYLHEQLNDMDDDLKDLMQWIKILNNNSIQQNDKIDNIAIEISEKISQFTQGINQKIENLSGDVSDVKNLLAGVQKTADSIKDEMEKQEAKIQDLKYDLANVKQEIKEEIKNILSSINEFKKEAKEDAASTTENILQQINALGQENKEFANKLNQDLLKKIEQFINETKKEGVGLKEEMDDLQSLVDNIQKQQNNCVDILNALQKSNNDQKLEISGLVGLVKENQNVLYKKFETLNTTSQIQVATMNEKLDKIQGEVTANKQEILGKISNVDREVIDIKKVLDKINQKSEDKYKQMDDVLKKTTNLSNQIKSVHSLVEDFNNSRSGDTQTLKSLEDKMKGLGANYSKLIDDVYDKLESFGKEQNAQKKQITEISSNQNVQGAQLTQLLDSDKQKTAQMEEFFKQYEKQRELINKLFAQNEEITKQNEEITKQNEEIKKQNEEIKKGQNNLEETVNNIAKRGNDRLDQIEDGQQEIRKGQQEMLDGQKNINQYLENKVAKSRKNQQKRISPEKNQKKRILPESTSRQRVIEYVQQKSNCTNSK